MKTTGWSIFRRPPETNAKRIYSPAAGKNLDGIDRAKLDEKELERRMAKELKEVWDE